MGCDWIKKWNGDGFFDQRRQKALAIIDYLSSVPASILDIGCGLAIESGLFQDAFKSELYLLDGDRDSSKGSREIGYGKINTMNFYLPISNLKKEWAKRGLLFQFVDANNISIPVGKKFDLIYSGKSCGFHYPLSAYKEILCRHSHKDTVFIFDLRRGEDQGPVNHHIIDTLGEGDKYVTCVLKLCKKQRKYA